MDNNVFYKKTFRQRMYQLSLIVFCCLFTINLSYAEPVADKALRGDNLLFETTIEFQPQASPAGFTSAEPYSAVWHAKNGQVHFLL